MTPLRIVGFDMATRTGWAARLSDAQPVQSGVFKYMRGNKPLCLEERLIKFRTDVGTLLHTYLPHAVCYEVAHHRGGPATRSGIGMETMLITECYMYGVPVFGVHSLTLKKFATGSGRAGKEEMIVAARELADKKVSDDNEADAICITKWGEQNVVIDEVGRPTLNVNVTNKTKKRGK